MLLHFGCTEVPPVLSPIDTSVPPGLENQQRQVLIEEFTGVRCVNCPRGSQAIQDLKAIYGERLVAVNIHAGFFAPPYEQSLYDFRTTEGTSLLSYLGQPLGYPTAVVNRKLFPGEERLNTGQNSWAGHVATEAAEAPLVKIDLQLNYDSLSRRLTTRVTLLPQVELPEADNLHLSVFLTEDFIADYQLTPAGWEAGYLHRHVFRTSLTPFNGQPLGEDLQVGRTVSRSFSFTLPENYLAPNCSVVAFVHRTGETLEVLQAVEAGVE